MGSAMEALEGSLSGCGARRSATRGPPSTTSGASPRVDGTPGAAATAAATPGGAPGLGSLGNIGGALLSALGGGGGM